MVPSAVQMRQVIVGGIALLWSFSNMPFRHSPAARRPRPVFRVLFGIAGLLMLCDAIWGILGVRI